ncbi:hypothetical protein M3589_07390 [Heyndrickxia oleronia]|uniref:hypothetical protein n=1 Tax=Heyndrickxia oleronia TaxID=38875 RepID=UPI0020401E3D|nr:hypothetical protein [Heyndrickxia oleronia]MCM3237547.1 hypothetical protein [Heyndrickxia oleronia]
MKRNIIWLSIIIGIGLIYGLVNYMQIVMENKAKEEKRIELKRIRKELEKDWKEIISKEKLIKKNETEILSFSQIIHEIDEELKSINKEPSKKISENDIEYYREKEKSKENIEAERDNKVEIQFEEIKEYKTMLNLYNKKINKASELSEELDLKWDIQPVFSVFN